MPLDLPHLDTRTWGDLVEEARAAIPRLAPEWTDHNIHDPGITLLELLAALVEQDVYRVNRVPVRVRRKLLALLDSGPRGPRAARVALTFSARPGRDPGTLPAGLEVRGRGDAGPALPFTLMEPVRPGPSRLAAVQVFDGAVHTDQTAAWAEGRPFAALGPDPAGAPALLLGLDPPPPAGRELVIWLSPAEDTGIPETAAADEAHTARIRWEVLSAGGWIDAAAVGDHTRGLTRAGTVRLTLAVTPPALAAGVVTTPMSRLRARLVAGPPDAAPRVGALALHTVPAAQSAAAHSILAVAPGALTPATVPPAGAEVPLALTLDADGAVATLSTNAGLGGPQIRILAADPSRLAIDAVIAGSGTGEPAQELFLPGAPVLERTVEVAMTDGAATRTVALRPDLDASGRRDAHAVLDPATGALRFGDGRRGRVVGAGHSVLAAYRVTAGAAGNLRAGADWALATEDALRNGALLGRPARDVAADLATIVNARPAAGGADGEDLDEAAGRAAARLWAHERLLELLDRHRAASLDDVPSEEVLALPAPERGLTLCDLERITLDAPGAAVARVRAWPELDPLVPGVRAPGTVTVVIIPSLPAGRPQPTAGLLGVVRAHVAERRIVGTRVFVVGPTYVEVTVDATVTVEPGADSGAAAEAARVRLSAFLHPRTGGPRGTGWPFGRDVYRSEVMQVVDDTAGIDHVESLTMRAGGGEPVCGNLCIPATSLVVSGPHSITASGA